MATLLNNVPLSVQAGTVAKRTFSMAAVSVDIQCADIVLSIQRPTSANPVTWDALTTLRVQLILAVDGQVHSAWGQATGGVRRRTNRSEGIEYRLVWSPTYGFFGARSGFPKRLGETARASYVMAVLIEHLRGNPVNTALSVEVLSRPAPDIPFHNPIAFDAATVINETFGDGVLSLTHTSTGADRAVFAGTGNNDDSNASLSTSVTYGGTSMVEMWDAVDTGDTRWAHAGYRLAGQATGAQTVTHTLASATPERQFLAVVSLTGVDQTTPVGTPASTETGFDTSVSVTVGSVGSTDFLLDNLYVAGGSSAFTVGANQTQRYAQTETDEHRGSSQSGADGGVMSWSWTTGNAAMLGAVAFKPAAGAGAAQFMVATAELAASGGMVGLVYA